MRPLPTIMLLLVATMPLQAGAYEVVDGSYPSFNAQATLTSMEISTSPIGKAMKFRRLHDAKKAGAFCGEMSMIERNGKRTAYKRFVSNDSPPYFMTGALQSPHENIFLPPKGSPRYATVAAFFKQVGCPTG